MTVKELLEAIERARVLYPSIEDAQVLIDSPDLPTAETFAVSAELTRWGSFKIVGSPDWKKA